MNRLSLPDTGLLLDRNHELRFTFDGVSYDAYPGDTIASALIAGGRTLLSRSFKYHRPRGALTMAGHDVNALMQVGDEPNVRADIREVEEGLNVTSINRYGSLDRDWAAGLGLLSRFLPVGFYYKTFFRPNGAWKYFERPIREMAGLGKLDPKATVPYFDKAYDFCDVLVIGAGPAGLNAARAAGEAGAEVILVDESVRAGGSLLWGRWKGERSLANERRAALVRAVLDHPNIRLMTKATASGLFSDGWASVLQGNRLYKIRAKHIVVATGAYDQPIVFSNNDRPGVMFADAAQRLIRLYGVKPGTKAVITTSNRFGYDCARDLQEAGVAVTVVDLTDGSVPNPFQGQSGAPVIYRHHAPIDTAGRKHITSVTTAELEDAGTPTARHTTLPCDLLLMSVGYTPALNLASHAGARIGYDPSSSMHAVTSTPEWLSVAGAAAGVWDEVSLEQHALSIGERAAKLARGEGSAPLPIGSAATGITHPYPIFTTGKGKDFIDFDEDLSAKDIVNAIKDGYDDIQLVKRYTTVGIGPSQGRHSNLNTIRVVAKVRGVDIESIGTTTFRPPLVPEMFGHMAGRAFDPVRRTPMHHRHEELGAQFMPAGAWKRPAFYGAKAGAAEAIEAEVNAVRNRVGLIDVSTLGKLEVRGKDAAAFIERMYTWTYAKQPIGKCKYLVMTDQAGVITDDGVAARLHSDHFYCTATTSGVDNVYRQMTFWNTRWKMDVDITNVTAAKAAVNIAGPKAREVLANLSCDIDLSASSFPYLGVRDGMLGGIPVRMMRVGFVGELGYEIHCPSGMGEALWEKLIEAGKAFGIRPFGVEAQRVLRLEKGHIIIGQDTDGLTNPFEASMDWAVGMSKPHFIGQRSLKILKEKLQSRRLIGFMLDEGAEMPKECHLILDGDEICGRVTSIARSTVIGRVVGLAFVPPGSTVPGSRLTIRVDGGRKVGAAVAALPFYDPSGNRQEL